MERRGHVRTSSAVALVGALAALGASCSTSYAPWGDGGCDTFCNRQVGARCRAPIDRDKCLVECVNNRALCPAHQRGLLRCANLEGNIVCDGDTGATKIANCGPAQEEVSACVTCATFCRAYVGLCARGNDLGECISSCLDPRCRGAHAAAMSNCGATLICGEDGFPTPPRTTFICGQSFGVASSCVRSHGGGGAFKWIPERLPADSGSPSVDATADDAFFVDGGTLPE